MKFLKLIQQDKNSYKFDDPLKFKFMKPMENSAERLQFVFNLLEELV